MLDLASCAGTAPGQVYPAVGGWGLLQATLQDMPFFTGLMRDHALFVRSGIDPTQSAVAAQAEYFAGMLEPLVEATCFFPPAAPAWGGIELVQETLPVVAGLRDFLNAVHRAVEGGRLLGGVLAPNLVDHLRREADWYIGMLGRTTCMPPATRGSLGLREDTEPAFTVPRAALAYAPPEAAGPAVLEAIEFWAQNQAEDAEVLASETIPRTQEGLRRGISRFVPPFCDLAESAYAAACGRRNACRVASRAVRLMGAWADFMRGVVEAVLEGDVPCGHTNFWPLLADHVYREAQYSTDLFRLGQAALASR